MLRAFDEMFIRTLSRYGVPILRISLAAVFIWFGYLKVIGQSPIAGLVESTYHFIDYPNFLLILGWVEIVIGAGLLFKLYLRVILALLWIQMLGTFASLFLNPDVFFNGSFLLLTELGEFVVKNIVLVAASLVIGGSEVKPR
jgi:uncharacterized membrane protein YkgB